MRKRIAPLMAMVLCAVVSQNAMAAADLGMRGYGAEIGYVSPQNLDGTMGFGVFANLGQLSPDIVMTSHLDFWSWSESAPLSGEASVRDVSLTFRGKYMFENTNPKFQPFAGAGLGLHFLSSKVSIPAQDLGGGVVIPAMSADDSATKLGLDIGGGFMMPMNPKTQFVTEMWYGIVSDVSQFSLKAGLEFSLPR